MDWELASAEGDGGPGGTHDDAPRYMVEPGGTHDDAPRYMVEPEGTHDDAPRYMVEPAISLDGCAVYALRDVKTQRIVKVYRSGAVALSDARFLNAVRPPLPLG